MLEEGRGWFDSIKSTPLRDRIFVLMLLFIFISIGYSVYITKTLTQEKNDERDLRVKAESELAIKQSENLKDSKDCTALILQIRQECDEKWQAKVEAKDELNKKYLEDKATQLEQEIKYLRNETRKVKNRTESMKNKIGS